MTKYLKENHIQEIYNMGYNLLDSYVEQDNKTCRLIIKDSENYIYDTRLDNLLAGKIPDAFSVYNFYTIKNIDNWIQINNKSFEIYEDNVYTGCNDKLKFKCHICEEIFYSTWNIISHGSACGICDGKQVSYKTSLAHLYPEIAKEWNYEKNPSSPENFRVYSNKVMWWKCISCNHEWKSAIADRQRFGCPACAGQVATNTNNVTVEFPNSKLYWCYNKNNDIPEHYRPYSDRYFYWICPNGIHEPFYRQIKTSVIYNFRCPKCSFSEGEDKIYNWLCNNTDHLKNIGIKDVVPQKRFGDCRDKRKLPFDFGLENNFENWFLIEYNGEQHFFTVDFAGKGEEWAKKEFEKNQKRDKIKKKYCEQNNIPLLVIPYWEINNIENILQEFFFG